MNDRRFITNNSEDNKLASMLGRLEGQMEGIKQDGQARTRQMEFQEQLLGQVREAVARLGTTVEAIRDDVKEVAAFDKRLRAAEQATADQRKDLSAVTDACQANTDFRNSIVNKLAVVGMISFVGGAGVSVAAMRLLLHWPPS